MQGILAPSVPGFEIFHFKQVDSSADFTGTVHMCSKCGKSLSVLLDWNHRFYSNYKHSAVTTACSKVQYQHFTKPVCPNLYRIFKSIVGTKISAIRDLGMQSALLLQQQDKSRDSSCAHPCKNLTQLHQAASRKTSPENNSHLSC